MHFSLRDAEEKKEGIKVRKEMITWSKGEITIRTLPSPPKNLIITVIPTEKAQ